MVVVVLKDCKIELDLLVFIIENYTSLMFIDNVILLLMQEFITRSRHEIRSMLRYFSFLSFCTTNNTNSCILLLLLF